MAKRRSRKEKRGLTVLLTLLGSAISGAVRSIVSWYLEE